ncbi:MAG: hypothetical protein IJ828_04210 [Treponema sp.]|nr:hypothetical protein [Treponema sp.]
MDNANQEESFNATVIKAIENKTAWFDSTQLVHVQDRYRNHLVFIKNMFDLLQKRSLVIPDPYKNERQISKVTCPDESPFNDNDRAQQLGIRLNDYETMLDYICNYMKFSVDQLTTDKIKKLLEFNNSFVWSNLTASSSRVNTRALGIALSELKNSGLGMAVGMLFDGLENTAHEMEDINKALKSLGNFHRERYKGEIRKNIIADKRFDSSALNDGSALAAEIKRLLPICMPKKPVYQELIQEIVDEETAISKEELRKKLLKRLHVEDKTKEAKAPAVDTHEIIMSAIRFLGSLAEQYNVVQQKIVVNHDILQSESNGFKDKLMKLIRRIFGLADPQVEYQVSVTERGGEQRKEIINYSKFMENLAKRITYYGTLTEKNSPNYQKMNSQKDDFIFNFVSNQLTENGRLHIKLTALDDFFKATAIPADRARIKGIKMELTTLKNILAKINQCKGEYAAYVEEAEQMKKLGIKDNE